MADALLSIPGILVDYGAYLTRCDDKFRAASWKSHDWDALNRLHGKGYIENPVSKNKSVGLTETGRAKSEKLFYKLFGKAK